MKPSLETVQQKKRGSRKQELKSLFTMFAMFYVNKIVFKNSCRLLQTQPKLYYVFQEQPK